jgi:lipopolysaccharide/colanic/teichoic acid biosynthesis glycosyltransferase
MLKRAFDIFSSGIVLFLLSPFLLIIAMVIKASSAGPVIFKQKRVGKNNQDFTIFKFRTMRTRKEEGKQITVGERDPRVTKVGYFLRKYKLDELPQLWNVLRGDMSIVGPRPEVRKYVDMYTPEQLKVLDVRPGLTDLASLEYINENEILGKAVDAERTYIEEVMPAKLKLNLAYLDKNSFISDVKLIFSTLSRIIARSEKKESKGIQ